MNPFHSLAVAALSIALTGHADTLDGQVISVNGGDTLTVVDAIHNQMKIRLVGIAAPEIPQAFGERSKTALAALAFNRNVKVEWSRRDRNGNVLGKVLIDGRDAGLEQIKSGMAWWYRPNPSVQTAEDQAEYSRTELTAKLQRAGLWAEKNPVPPWEWRHERPY